MSTIKTEGAEIVGGPLCGTRLSVVEGRPFFQCGKNIVFHDDLKHEAHKTGAMWVQGHLAVDTYVRTEKTTSSGRRIYTIAETETV